MADHYACIGLRFADAEAWKATVMGTLVAKAEQQPGPSATRLWWSDASGACHAAYGVDRQIVCAKPSFDGASRIRVRITGRTESDQRGCPMCEIALVEVLDGDTMAYPLGVELDDIHLGSLQPEGAVIDLTIAAFAESSRRWPDVATYESAAPSPRFAAQSLIPSGLFSAGEVKRPPRPEAIVTGLVTKSERRANTLTGGQFDWVLLETYGGIYDMLLPAIGQPYAPGQVIQGTFWLVAHRAGLP
jgi:hypothetical protein